MRIWSASALLILVLLCSCGEGSNAADLGGVSADDAQALDEAAARLDAEASVEPESVSPPAK